MVNRKLRTWPQLSRELDGVRGRLRIVFTNGCFDVLHPGHIAYFEFCRAQGEVLVVGLDSDQSVRVNQKAPDRPIYDEHERAWMLGALAAVDLIAFFDDGDPRPLVEVVRPDVLVKGADWANKTVLGRECVEGYGGRVVLAPRPAGYSTTAIIERIRGEHSRV